MSRAPQSSHSVPHQIFACHLSPTQQQYGRHHLSQPPVMPNIGPSLGLQPLLTHHQQVLPSGQPPSHQYQTSTPRHPPPAYQQLGLPLRQSSPAHQYQQQHMQQALLSRDPSLTNQHQAPTSFQPPPTHQQQTFPQRDPPPAHQQPPTSRSSLSTYPNLPMTSMTHLMNQYRDLGASSHAVDSTVNSSTQAAMRLYLSNRAEPQVQQGTDGSSSLRATLHPAFPHYPTMGIPGVGSSQSSSMASIQSYPQPVQPSYFQSTTSAEPLHTLGLGRDVYYQINSQRSAQSQSSRISNGTLPRTVGSQCNTGGEFCNTSANTYHNSTRQSISSASHQQSISQSITRTQNMGINQMIPVGETDQQGNSFLRCLLRLDLQTSMPNVYTDSLRSGSSMCNMNTREVNTAVSRASISTTNQPLTSHPLQIPNEVPFIVPPNWNPAAAAALHSRSQQDDSEQDGTSSRLLGRWYQVPGMEKKNTDSCLPMQIGTKDTESLKSSNTESHTEMDIISPHISNSLSTQMLVCTSTSQTNVTSSAGFISIPSAPSLMETETMELKPPTTSHFSTSPNILADAPMTQNKQLVASSDATVFQGSSHAWMTLNNVQVQEVSPVSSSSKTAGFSGQEPELIMKKGSLVPCPGLNSQKDSNSSSVSPNNNNVQTLGKVQNVNLSNATGDLSEQPSLSAKESNIIAQIRSKIVQTMNPKDLSKEELAQKIKEIDCLISQSKHLVAKKQSGRRETSITSEIQSEYATEDSTAANSLVIGQIAREKTSNDVINGLSDHRQLIQAESETPFSKNNKTNESHNPPNVSAEKKEGRTASDRHVSNSNSTSADVTAAPVIESLSPAANQIDIENGVSSSGLGICILNTFSLAHIEHKSSKKTLHEAKNTEEGKDITKKRKLGDEFVTSMVKKSKRSFDSKDMEAEDDSNSNNESISGRRAVLELHVEEGNKTITDITSAIRRFHTGDVEVLEISEEEGDSDDVAEEHKRPQTDEKQCERGSQKEKTATDNATKVDRDVEPEAEVNEITTLSHVAFTDSKIRTCFKLVTFHDEKLLEIETKSGKLFIMKELLNKCFERFRQKNYFLVFKAKEYHLKIPSIDLPKKFKPYTILYLKLNKILKPGQSNPNRYISVIEPSDAERLYLFDFNKISMNSLSNKVKDGSVSVDCHYQNANQERQIDNLSSPATPKSVPAPEATISDDPVVITSSDSDSASNIDSLDSDCTLPYIDGKGKHSVLKKIKTPKKTRPSQKQEQSRKDQDKSDVLVGGTVEMNGVSMRYIYINEKRYIPFEDLARSFPQINIYSYLKKGNCPMINCPLNEVNIFNSTDLSLPKLGKNPVLVEYDGFQSIVHSLEESASPTAAGSQEKEHISNSTAKKLLALYSKTLQKLKESFLPDHEAESSGKGKESCLLYDSPNLKSPAATKPTVTEVGQNVNKHKTSPNVVRQKTSSKMSRTVGKLLFSEVSDSSITNEKSSFDNKSVQMSNMFKHSCESPIEKADKTCPTLIGHSRMAEHSSQGSTNDVPSKKISSAVRVSVKEQIRQAMLKRPYVALERISPFIVKQLMGSGTKLLKIKIPFKSQKENSTTAAKYVIQHNLGQQNREAVPLKEICLPIQDLHQRNNLKKPAAKGDLGSQNATACSINICHESVGLVNQNTDNSKISGQCHVINCQDSRNVSTPGNHDSGGNSFPEDGLLKSIQVHEDVNLKDVESNDGRKIVSSRNQNIPMTVDSDEHGTGRNFLGRDIAEMEHEDIDSNTNTLVNEVVLEASSDQPAICPTIEQRDNTYNSLLEEIQTIIDEAKKGEETSNVNACPSDYSVHENFQASFSNAHGLTTSRLQFFGRPSESREGDQFFRFGEQFDNILLAEPNSEDSLQKATILAFQEQSQLNDKLAESCQKLRNVINQMQTN